MPDFYITSAQPNPAGKDRPPHGGASQRQLNQEWVEYQNTTQKTLSLDTLRLFHYTFDNRCQKTGENQLTYFWGSLSPGHSIRVHTGSGQVSSEGVLHHLYLNRENYVWNNACGDFVVLRLAGGARIDWAHYVPNPPERILRRVQNTNLLG
ncbi:MAG TPA: lamin tail domain-containing protein [Gemmatimonadales bacterium]|nr:lamin tail domain-containing protein [Gemmatimonadales bacterium]